MSLESPEREPRQRAADGSRGARLERSLRTGHLLVALVVGGALAATPWLLPTSADIGAHFFSDRRSGQARLYLQDALKWQHKEPEVVVPLAELEIERGHFERALSLLARLEVQVQTPEIEAMRRRAMIGAGRTRSYVMGLELERRLRPSVRLLRELARVYGEEELLELQIGVLEQLHTLEPGEVRITRELAWLASKAGQRGRALTLLRGLWRSRPDVFEPSDFRTLVELEIEQDPSRAALRRVVRYGSKILDPAGRAQLAARFQALGRPREARVLLASLVGETRPELSVLRIWVQVMIAQGALDELRQRLRVWIGGGVQDREVVGLFCTLALDGGATKEALAVASQVGFKGLKQGLLLRLAQAAATRREQRVLGRILGRLSEETLAARPVLALYLALSVRGRAGQGRAVQPRWGRSRSRLWSGARRWAKRALQAEGLPLDRRLWLVELMLEMRQPREAAAVLRRAGAESLEPGAAEPLRVALLWWRSEAAVEGLRFFDERRAGRSAELLAGRALLLAAAEKEDAALSLLRSRSRLVSSLRLAGRAQARAWLQGLLAIAQRASHAGLSTYALRELLASQPRSRRLRLGLAQAELAGGHPKLSLATMRGLSRPLRGGERQAWRQMLLAAWHAGASVREELINVTVAYAKTLRLRKSEGEGQVYLLLELKATREALPFVVKLAALRGGAWKDREIALRAELGEARKVWSLWRAMGLDEGESSARRLYAAQQLLRSRDRQTALRIYQVVAEDEGPEGKTVKQLVHIWGPRAGSGAIAWIRSRVRTSTGADRLAWLGHLVSVGGAREAIALLGEAPLEGPELNLLLDLRLRRGEHAAVAALVRRQAPSWSSQKTLRRVAKFCEGTGERGAAKIAWSRLLQLRPDDPEALRVLARDPTTPPNQAAAYWRAWFALPRSGRGAASWRDRLAYGELRLGQVGGRAEGRAQLRRALDLLTRAKLPAVVRARERGRLWSRLERPERAAPLLARALAAHPCDDALRADLVSALMANRALNEARAVIDPPARCNRGSGATLGGQP